MPVSPARAAAFDILLRVERESSYASELLHSSAYQKLSTADHGLTTEVVMGVLRWRSSLDSDISRASSQPLKKLDLEILVALRMALYQLRWLDRVPQRAALHESVELVKRARKRSAASFVNAVLRKLATQSQGAVKAPRALDPTADSSQEIAETWAHPLWLVERWAHAYGSLRAQRICEFNQSLPITSIRLRSAEGELAGEGVSHLPGALLSSARRIQSGDVTRTRTFRERQVVIQDEASQLVAALVGSGRRILDCCAAPGGKTLAMADRNLAADITAVEIHPHRARLMQQLVGAEASPRIKTVIADAGGLEVADKFDRILADVPCSGTGTLARNPEIKWRLRAEDLRDLHERQLAILRSALGNLTPGGRLVYSTCSLEKEENEDVVEEALARNDSVGLLDCRQELDRLKADAELTWADPASLMQGLYFRTIPGVHPCDGFFAAIMEKKK
jgi:16S rRNA (cytosine967-C5)-methyltransferase